MKTHTQTDTDLSQLADKLSDHRVTMMTMADGNPGLSSRPMTALEMDADGAIWMMASRRAIPPQLGSQGGAVNLAFVGHSDGDYISVAGTAALIDDMARKEALWTIAARPWFNGPTDPDLVLLKVTPQRADIWDGPDNAVTRTLGMVASIVAGREVGLGHKDVVRPGPGSVAT